MILEVGTIVQHIPTRRRFIVTSILKSEEGILVTIDPLKDGLSLKHELQYQMMVNYYDILINNTPYPISGYVAGNAVSDIKKEVMEEVKTKSQVDHPEHYNQGKYECIDVMEETFGKDAVIQFSICNAFKYLYRCKHKDAMLQDLNKAKWYIEKAISLIDKTKPIV